MFTNDTREKLENIIGGTVIEEQADTCTTIRNLLCTSFETSTTTKTNFERKAADKKEQAAFLKIYARKNNLWLNDLPEDCKYLTRGGESTIYLSNDNRHVIKMNDAVYYATWLEYFNSLIIHNLLFRETAYILSGFIEKEGILYAVLKQVFVKADSQAGLTDIKEFLNFNGFQNIKRNDYYNSEFHLLLEDMHDENIISASGSLFFIDTVFYIVHKNDL